MVLRLLLSTALWFADVAVPHRAPPPPAAPTTATAAERRAAFYRALFKELAPMIDAGELQLVIRYGRPMAIFPADELFEAGKSQLLPSGRKRVVDLRRALTRLHVTHLDVRGHTDNAAPDENTTNEAFSSARALAIRAILGHAKIAVTAIGRGELEPIAPNDTDEDRRRNRRIEIVINLD